MNGVPSMRAPSRSTYVTASRPIPGTGTKYRRTFSCDTK
jgi:hypothetical protein